MKQYNCKNCGSPIEHSYNHRCPYCNTLFDFNEFTKNVSQIDVQKYFILCNTTIKIEDRKFVHEKNETETSVFFEQNGNMNNNKYGTDQGIIYSLLQYEKDGKTWSYNEANDIIEKCKEEHKVIPKFYEKFTDEYKKIKNTMHRVFFI